MQTTGIGDGRWHACRDQYQHQGLSDALEPLEPHSIIPKPCSAPDSGGQVSERDERDVDGRVGRGRHVWLAPAGGERAAVQALRHVHAAPDQALRDRELRGARTSALWGLHTTSWVVLRCLVPLMMLLMMYQPHLNQPWRLDRCNPVIHSFGTAPRLWATPRTLFTKRSNKSSPCNCSGNGSRPPQHGSRSLKCSCIM